jgi:hypothetical protein
MLLRIPKRKVTTPYRIIQDLEAADLKTMPIRLFSTRDGSGQLANMTQPAERKQVH